MAISTFVIFDIETTGLPRHERNWTKITELTFLAVTRRDIERASTVQLPVVNKVSYLYDPQRKIQPEVSSLTGLTNSMLKNQAIFQARIPSLVAFLQEQRKPVCLVAHNGNSFDFKMLQSEFIDAGGELPGDLLCVDSLWGFKKILKETNLCYKTLPPAKICIDLTESDDDLLTDDEDWPDFNTTAEEWDEIDRIVERFSKIPRPNPPSENKRNQKSSPGIAKSNNGHADKTAAIKNVFEKKPKTDNIICTLQALYKRLLNKEPVNAHRSEGDCMMLLECIVALKDYFLPYADNKCKLISEVNPFQPY